MTGKLFKYYFLDASGNYYYVDSDGTVSTTATKTPVKDSPEGWEQQGVKFGRDEKLFGIFQSVTVPLKFRGDGKKILETLYYQDGGANFEAYCQVLIEKRHDGSNNVWSYKTWFDGKADFSEIIQDEDQDGNFLQIRLIENGYRKIFDANRDKTYEIPLTGIPEAKVVQLDGVKLEGDYNFITGDVGNVSMPTGTGFVFPMGMVNVDSTDYFRNQIYFTNQGFEVFSLGSTPNDANSFLYTDLSFQATITLTMDFNWLGAAGSDLAVVLLRKNMAANTNTIIHTFYSSGAIGGVVINASFTNSTTVTFDTYPYRYFIQVFPNLAGNYTIDVDSVDFNVNFNEALPTTDTQAIRLYDYAKLLVEEAFEGQVTLRSHHLKVQGGDLLYDFYDMLPWNVFITSGDAIRRASDPVIKGTLNELIQDVFARHMCGCGLEGNEFVIETLEYFLDKTTQISQITNPVNIKKTTAKQFVYNTIRAGYPQYRANDLNGRFEVNSQQQFSMPIQSVVEERDLVSPYKSSVYEIEYLRGDVFNQETRDKDNDNSKFLVYCNSFPTNNKFTLKKHANGVFGVPNPSTHYNIEFSPHRIVNKHIPFHKSIMNIPDDLVESGYRIDFLSGDRNTALTTQINGAPPGLWIDEGADIYPAEVPVNRAKDKLFIPLILEFQAKPQPELLEQIRDYPYGYLRVVNGSNTFDCFILDIDITGAETDSFKFITLLSPESDVKQFIS